MSEDQSDIPQLKTIEDPVITLPNVIPLVSQPIVNVVTSLSGTKGPESGVVTSSPSPKETKDNQINRQLEEKLPQQESIRVSEPGPTTSNKFRLIESFYVVKMKGLIEYIKQNQDTSNLFWLSNLFEDLLKKNPETQQLPDTNSIINIPIYYNESDLKSTPKIGGLETKGNISILKRVPMNIRNYLCNDNYYYIYIPKANGIIFIEQGFIKYLIKGLEKSEQATRNYSPIGPNGGDLSSRIEGIKSSVTRLFNEQGLILRYFTRKRINKEEFISEFQKKLGFDPKGLNPKDFKIIKELFNYHSEFYSNYITEIRGSLNGFSFSTVSEIFETLNLGLVRQMVDTIRQRNLTLTCIMDDGVIIPRFESIQSLLELIELIEYRISNEYQFDIELRVDFMRNQLS